MAVKLYSLCGQARNAGKDNLMSEKHKKKMIAPVVITVVMILYYLVYFGFMIAAVPGIVKIILGVIPLALAAVSIYVCVERIREIRGGEEDDLSEY